MKNHHVGTFSVSIESLKTFYECVRSDPELEALATNALEDGPESLVVLGFLKGFEFTEEEILAALSRRSAPVDGELSDADLDLVAGGTASMAVAPNLGKETARRP